MPGQVFLAQVITVQLKDRKLMDIPKLGTLKKEPNHSKDIIFLFSFFVPCTAIGSLLEEFYVHDSQDCFVRLYYSRVLFA